MISAIFVWRALQNFAMADFEENVEEIVGSTKEAAGGDSLVGTRPVVPAVPGRDRRQDGGDGW